MLIYVTICSPHNPQQEGGAETEIHRERGSIAPWKVLRVWKVFCTEHTFVYYIWNLSEKSLKFLESYKKVWKVSRWSEKFPDFQISYCLKSFKIVCNFFILSGRFPDCLETLQIVYIFSRLSRKFSDCLYLFQVVWEVFHLSRKFPSCL